MNNYIPCPRCGEMIDSQASKCPYCRSFIRTGTTPPPPPGGYNYAPGTSPFERNEIFADAPSGQSRGVTALFAIFLGTFGAQYFYLGKTTAGVVCLLLFIFTCGSIPALLGLIQGIIMFGMTNENWYRHYVTTPSSFPI